ncbi:class I SAM-dependent methyltransferase [Paenibacillus sp. YPG26]|uniref:class I SAM-dependent methyltransferase n=1 Tax=Paenibacillus sp. YPG26 TaxID=2878915 RepID=UPI00203AB415|nr:class I SAM-dependent methyltransferase [Paenibacillus sp. YPG26]USB31835.1 class I SAM-dependent methyltransferase [Paenibacillus sp. YPG26]
MDQAKFEEARKAEETYHSKLYNEKEILEPGTWMSEPIPLVMELLDRLMRHTKKLNIMDLGSGAGRNTIPVALKLKGSGSRVAGIDLLDEAVDKLRENATQYDVEELVDARKGDAEHTDFGNEEYDYIIACGCLEHVSSEEALIQVLERMKQGTRLGGIHCIGMNTNVQEVEMNSGKELETLIELNLSSTRAVQILEQVYDGWNVLEQTSVLQSIEEDKYEEPTEFRAQSISFAVQRIK